MLTTGCWKVASPLPPAPVLKLVSPAVVTCGKPVVYSLFMRRLQAAKACALLQRCSRRAHLRLLFLLLKELLSRGVELRGRLQFDELTNARPTDLLIPVQFDPLT